MDEGTVLSVTYSFLLNYKSWARLIQTIGYLPCTDLWDYLETCGLSVICGSWIPAHKPIGLSAFKGFEHNQSWSSYASAWILLAFRVLFAPQGQIGCLCDFWTLLRAVYQIFPLFLSMTASEPIGASISFNCLICSTGVSLARRPCLMMICAIIPFEWNGAWLTSHLDVHNSEMERRTIPLGDPLLQSAWLWLSWCVIHWKMEHKLLDKILVWYSLGWM